MKSKRIKKFHLRRFMINIQLKNMISIKKVIHQNYYRKKKRKNNEYIKMYIKNKIKQKKIKISMRKKMMNFNNKNKKCI